MRAHYYVCLEDNVQVASLDPSQEYSSIGLFQLAPPVAHAALAGDPPEPPAAQCRTGKPLISLKLAWDSELPGHWVRCPDCLATCQP